MFSFNNQLPSLSKRYIRLTILLGIVVMALVSFSYAQTLKIKNKATNAYDRILLEQAKLEAVRNTLLTINLDINSFLLDPLNEDLMTKIGENTQKALVHLENFQPSVGQPPHDSNHDVASIIDQFLRLQEEVNTLVEYRTDINKQYPALDINANVMEAQQTQIRGGFELMLNEIESGDLELVSSEAYPLLLKAYAAWINAISQTRIYAVNRLAAFELDIMEQQGTGVRDLYLDFVAKINRLSDIYSEEDSFEGPQILQSMESQSGEWFQKFLDMRRISESDQWRADTLIMKQQVFPIVAKITDGINQLELVLKNEKLQADELLKQSDDYFSFLILAIIVIFSFFIIAILFSMQWMIFNPIQRVSMALKSRAFDMDHPHLEAAKTQEIHQLVTSFIEMDEEITHRQNALEHQALHDHLTGLPNRFMLNQRMEYQLLSSEESSKSFALFIMDLNYFKEVNDSLGHAMGDRLLVEIASRVLAVIRKTDTLARLGGDEFALLLPNLDKKQAEKVAISIVETIHQPFKLNGEVLQIGISIGMVCYPENAQDSETLFQFADMAMYQAKRQKTGYAFFESTENIYNKERLLLNNQLPVLIDSEGFELYFQPKLNLGLNEVYGAEALIRWNHPEVGFISPERIIEAAERTGLIHQLSFTVLKMAIKQCRVWHDQGHFISISVNLSALDLSNKGLDLQVKQLMKEYQLDYSFLILEITETAMMENVSLALEQLNKLAQLGVGLSIDDFGTGFSSLAYLKRLPVTELKIDKSFIMDINEDANDKMIVHSTVNLGHNLGLKVVAEGIEDQTALDSLKALNCDYAQGYFIGKPMNVADFDVFIKQARFG